MAFVAISSTLGEVDLSAIDPAGPGVFNPFNGGATRGLASFYMEEIKAYDPNLGAGTFVYAKFSGAIAAGTVVEFTPTLVSGQIIMSATAWAGTANSGKQIGAAVASGAAGQWGWFQVQGNAIVTSQGAPVAGNPVYWQAAGVVSPTAVAGKQLMGATFSTAPGITLGSGTGAIVLSATQAVINMAYGVAQGAIT